MKRAARWKHEIFYLEHRLPCSYCGALLLMKMATVDHYVPLCRGGRDHPVNFRLACRGCNLRKANMLPPDAVRAMFREGVRGGL